MKKIIVLILSAIFINISAQSDYSSIAGKAGSFSRMGFGARGMGMANSLTAVNSGNLVAYYNPALSVFQEGNSFQTSYSFLSFDRSLNFLNYTRKFELGWYNPDGSRRDKPRSTAGLSVGVINSGISNFDERDNQGIKTGDLSPFENQFFMALGMRVSSKLAIGFNAKFYYTKLYEEVTSTTFGFDLGFIYLFNENITIAGALVDLNSKYKWDTTKIYGQEGTNTEDQFPVLKKLAVAYKFDDPELIASIEFEGIDGETNFLRVGAEYNLIENLFLRGGLNNFNLSNTDFPVRPSFGFSYFYAFGNVVSGIDYAFVVEPYSASDQHIIGVNFNF